LRAWYPGMKKPVEFAGAYLIARDVGTIQRRVLRLMQLAEQQDHLELRKCASNLKLAAYVSGSFWP